MTTQPKASNPSLSERFWEEMKKYGIVSAYLYVCFLALLMFEASVAGGEAKHALHYGTAAVKALVIGKFILIGEVINVGARGPVSVLLHRIGWKTLAFLVMLMVFTILEEVIVGWAHGHTVGETWAEFASRSWVQMVAPSFVMLLVLVPLISLSELNRAMGPGVLKRLLTEGQQTP